jgi:hypothetical protein
MVRILLMSVVVMGIATFTHAGMIPIIPGTPNEVSPEATFEGWISYDNVSKFTVSLTNTSPIDNGGYITGFVFNIDGNATATLNPNPTGSFQNLLSPGAPPYGSFDAGAALGGDWSGGGSPLAGIGVGQTMVFEFDITGPDASSLSVENFLSRLSQGQGGNGKTEAFVVRFRGFEDGGSNMVPAIPIPLPPAASAGLGTMGMIGGLGYLRRFNPRHLFGRSRTN